MSTPSSYPLFDPERLRVYPRLAVGVYILAAIALVASATAMVDVFGKPLGYDFITFWGASHLTLQGDALAVFDHNAILMAEQVAVPANEQVFLWHYPPIYQMFVTPLALLPYAVSFLAFVALGLWLFVRTLSPLFDRGVATGSDALFLLLAFPGVFICVFHGQNSLFSAAIFAGGLLALERGRPWLAGIVLGFLIYKPQLGVLLPFAFLITGQWRVFIATGMSAAIITAMATVIFGIDLWQAFFQNTALVRDIMEQGFLPWAKMPSAFIFLREFGVPEAIAYAAQIATAIGAMACTVYVWWKNGSSRMSWAVQITATLLIPPYTFDYELAILAPVLIILASDMVQRGAGTKEKILLAAIYVLPICVAPLAEATHIQLGFPLLLVTLALALRRSFAGANASASLPTPAHI